MKFSVVHFPRSWDETQDEAVIDLIIQDSLEADALGFNAVFLPEHHFHGYSPTGSDIFQIAAFLAPQLKQAWLGTSVVVVPLHHPVRLVEQMNLLDQLTKGRILFGIGSGIHAEEGVGFGLNFDHQIAHMTNEGLDAAERLWSKSLSDPPVHFKTRYYEGDVLERVVPSPYRKRRPLMMGVAGRDASIARAAREGWPVFVSGAQGWGNLWAYRKALAAAGHPPEVVARCMEWTTETFQGMFVADTDEEAKANMLTAMAGHQRFNDRQLPFIREAERISGVSAEHMRVRPPATDPRYYNRWCVWGSPDTVAVRIQAFADIGLGNLLMSFNNGLYDPERRAIQKRSIKLFVDEVMPRFANARPPADPLAIHLGEPEESEPAQERLAYN